PRKRLRDIGDAWELLSSENAGDPRPAISRSGSLRRNVWPAAAMALALLLGALAYIHFRERSPAPEMVRFEFNVPNALSATAVGSAPPLCLPMGNGSPLMPWDPMGGINYGYTRWRPTNRNHWPEPKACLPELSGPPTAALWRMRPMMEDSER